MRSLFISLMALCCFVAAIMNCGDDPTKPSPSTEQIAWSSSSVIYDTNTEKKDHSLIFFLADWCGWCKKLKTETLTDPQVVNLIDSSFNAVCIDPDADTVVAYFDSLVTCGEFTRNKYGITGYPTTIACNRSGIVVGKFVGYGGPTAFSEWLRNMRLTEPVL